MKPYPGSPPRGINQRVTRKTKKMKTNTDTNTTEAEAAHLAGDAICAGSPAPGPVYLKKIGEDLWKQVSEKEEYDLEYDVEDLKISEQAWPAWLEKRCDEIKDELAEIEV